MHYWWVLTLNRLIEFQKHNHVEFNNISWHSEWGCYFATELLEKYKICKNVLKVVYRKLSRIFFFEFTTELVFNSQKSSSFGKNNV